MAYLRFKGSLGKCLCTLVYGGSVVSMGYQQSTLASQQRLASLCSCSSQRKVAVSRNLSLQEVAQGSVTSSSLPCDTWSWAIPAPHHGAPEVGFKLLLELAQASLFH